MKNSNLFGKIGLLTILFFGWAEKIFSWEGVPEGMALTVKNNLLTAWMAEIHPLFPNYFIGIFELITFLLLIIKEKYGAILSCITFLITLSFLFNGFSFFFVKDIVMLGISIDLLLKNIQHNK